MSFLRLEQSFVDLMSTSVTISWSKQQVTLLKNPVFSLQQIGMTDFRLAIRTLLFQVISSVVELSWGILILINFQKELICYWVSYIFLLVYCPNSPQNESSINLADDHRQGLDFMFSEFVLASWYIQFMTNSSISSTSFKDALTYLLIFML